MAASMKTGATAAIDEVDLLLKSTVTETKEQSTTFAASMSSNQTELEQRTISALGALTSAVAKHAEQLQSGFAARHSAGIEAASGALSNLSSETQHDLARSIELINNMRQEIDEKNKENEASLALVAASIEDSARKQQEELMKKVSEMLASFTAERGQQATKALDQARLMMTAGVKKANELALFMNNETDAVMKKLKVNESTLSSAVMVSGEEVKRELMELGSAILHKAKEGEAAVPLIEASIKHEKALVSSYVQDLVSHLNQSSQAGAKNTLAAKGQAENVFADLNRLLTVEIKGAMEAQGEVISASAAKIMSAADEASNKMNAFDVKFTQDAHEISGNVAGAVTGQMQKIVVVASGPEIGKIPQKRAILDEGAPALMVVHELACPPEDALLMQFKKEKTQALRSSGGSKHPAPPSEGDIQGPPEKKMRRTTEVEATENVVEMAPVEEASVMEGELRATSPTKNVTHRSRIPRGAGLVDKSNQI